MVTLEIIATDNKKYLLKQNEKLNKIELLFDFFDVDALNSGDQILISENLLNKTYEGFCQPYCFEFLMECTNKDLSNIKSEDFIILNTNGKKHLMKRIYG